MLIGSLEWFREEAKSDYNRRLNEKIENRRDHFLNWFAPDKLMEMDKSTLLIRVFSPKETSMIHILMFDGDCRWFGAPGKYAYAGVLYYDQGRSTWKFKTGQSPVSISREEAEEKALYMRKQLLYCVNCIKDIGVFHSIADYRKLQSKISSVFFSQYAWTLKYYQMLFPEFFPSMYTEHTINRALQILGLPDHGNKLLNAGEISLFIRRCNINNIVFGNIYGTKWGWEREYPACEAAADNLKLSYYPVKELDVSMYRTPQSVGKCSIPIVNLARNSAKTEHGSKTKPEKSKDNEISDAEFVKLFPVDSKVNHKAFGNGIVKDVKQGIVMIDFDDLGRKELGTDICIKRELLARI